jgi:hypothetical protein
MILATNDGQCRRERGVPVQITGARLAGRGPGLPEGGPGSNCVAHGFIFLGSIIICRLYKLTLSDQAQVTLQLGVTLFDLA